MAVCKWDEGQLQYSMTSPPATVECRKEASTSTEAENSMNTK